MTEEQISKDEFKNWQENKVTKYINEALRDTRDRLIEFLAGGGTINKEAEVTTDFVVGKVQGLNEFLSVQYEETDQEKRDSYGH